MKILFLALIIIVSINSFSQTRPVISHTDKGMKMVGVQVELAATDLFRSETILRVDDYSSNVGLVVSPNIGWFVEKNWLIGGMAHLGFYKEHIGKNSPTETSKENSFDLGLTPFTRYYIDLSRRGNIKFLLQAGLPVIYSNYKTSSTYSTGTQTYSASTNHNNVGFYGNFGFGASIHGGFGALEINVSNLGLNLGFQKFINKRRK